MSIYLFPPTSTRYLSLRPTTTILPQIPPFTTMSATTRRPGPLRELPLEQFLPSSSNLSQHGPFKSNKRPHSPGPTLFSPVKRRILNEEGIFSPDKTIKSPVRGMGASTALFADFLHASPAKRLKFDGPSKQMRDGKPPMASTVAGEATPKHTAASSRSLAASPELASASKGSSVAQASCRNDDIQQEIDDYFSSPHHLPSVPATSGAPTMIPHELLPLPGPKSIHYPGFSVYIDTHIPLPSPPSDADSSPPVETDKAGYKENLPPRRKSKRLAGTPASDLKSPILSADGKKGELGVFKTPGTPSTPKKNHRVDRTDGGSPTPRRLSVAPLGGSPIITDAERKARRRALEAEVNEAGGNGEDEDEDIVM